MLYGFELLDLFAESFHVLFCAVQFFKELLDGFFVALVHECMESWTIQKLGLRRKHGRLIGFFEELGVAGDSDHKFADLTGKEGSIKWGGRLFIFDIVYIVHMYPVYYFFERFRELVLHYKHYPDHSVVVVQDFLFFQDTLVFHALEETPLDIIPAGPS